MVQSIEWEENHLRIIDQTELPVKTHFINLYTIEEVFEAIKKLRVRGAPAIGVTAAYGLYLGVLNQSFSSESDFFSFLDIKINYLTSSRPTAVNLQWSLQRIKKELSKSSDHDFNAMKKQLLEIAIEIHEEDKVRCKRIADNGQDIIKENYNVLTHCNTGALATGGIGTALGIIFQSFELGKNIKVFATETRPLLQGARLTVWELNESKIPATLICDSTVAWLMNQKKIDLVIVGADRIAADGSTANKIGTFNLAILANYYKIPFYIAAPLSTVDVSVTRGDQIPIEFRDSEEVRNVFNKYPITIAEIDCWNPAFDITPPELISGIVTDQEIILPPFESNIKKAILKQTIN